MVNPVVYSAASLLVPVSFPANLPLEAYAFVPRSFVPKSPAVLRTYLYTDSGTGLGTASRSRSTGTAA